VAEAAAERHHVSSHCVRWLLRRNARGLVPPGSFVSCPGLSESEGDSIDISQKYPHIVVGAIAASAPILQFYNTGVSEYVFNQV
jgi:hypothetical protein